jgi:hypothetical protein
VSHVLFYSSMGKVVSNTLFVLCFVSISNSYNKQFFPMGNITEESQHTVLIYGALSAVIYFLFGAVALSTAAFYYKIPVVRTVTLDMKRNFWLFYGTSLGSNTLVKFLICSGAVLFPFATVETHFHVWNFFFHT